MSTLSSLYYDAKTDDSGKLVSSIHVAEELIDGNVVIEIEGLPSFAQVTRNAVELRLPLATWATIRQYTPGNERYLTMTDEELRREAEVWVKRRIDEFDPARPLTGVGGSLQAGDAADAFDVQVERYIQYYAAIRDGRGGPMGPAED